MRIPRSARDRLRNPDLLPPSTRLAEALRRSAGGIATAATRPRNDKTTPMKNNLIIRAFLHSLGVLIYTSLIAAFLFNGEKLFGKVTSFLMPAAILLLLVLSAAITGALVLGKPILLYLDNQKADALKLFGWTVGWLAVITITILIILTMVK